MSSWAAALRRWTEAGLIDPGAAERIRSWERGRGTDPGARWPARLALGLGGLMVGAGILLFVAAHWDGLSPGQRFVLVLVPLLFIIQTGMGMGMALALSTATVFMRDISNLVNYVVRILMFVTPVIGVVASKKSDRISQRKQSETLSRR